MFKICTKCNIEKELSDFYKQKEMKDGYRNECKKCICQQQQNRHKIIPWKPLLSEIKRRCNNKNYKQYKDYGGRNIKFLLTKEEIKFLWFRDKAYFMDKPSIDRIDNDGNYILSNCEFIEMDINRIKDRYKSIIQYSLDEKFIKEYQSITEASKKLNICYSTIVSCCIGRYKTAGGFKWRYVND